jgi:hypothetical protein
VSDGARTCTRLEDEAAEPVPDTPIAPRELSVDDPAKRTRAAKNEGIRPT